MPDLLPALRPACKRHGPMTLRRNPDAIAQWCGTWYDCGHQGCWDSHLLASPALMAALQQQAAA